MPTTATSLPSPPRPVKRSIRLASRDAATPLEVTAEVYSDDAGNPALAIHKRRYGWTISHVRTGYSITEVIGTKALTLQVLAILLTNADWNVGEFSGDPDPVCESARPALHAAHAIQFPDSPLPPYRTRREERIERLRIAQRTWDTFAERPTFLAWATPEIDYTSRDFWGSRTRFAVVKRMYSGITWARVTASGDGGLFSAEESGACFYDDVAEHPEGGIAWAMSAARKEADAEHAYRQRRVRRDREAREAQIDRDRGLWGNETE